MFKEMNELCLGGFFDFTLQAYLSHLKKETNTDYTGDLVSMIEGKVCALVVLVYVPALSIYVFTRDKKTVE